VVLLVSCENLAHIAYSQIVYFVGSILIDIEDVSEAGRFMARAAMRQLLEPDKPPMQHLQVPIEHSGEQ